METLDERLIGVISDTHGLIRPEALEALRGCDLIIHAGDVGKPEVLETLKKVARVAAVRGNMDKGEWAEGLPKFEVVEVAERYLYVIHDLMDLDVDPVAAGFSAVVYGHSHVPSFETRHGVLLLNPGSAGPRRFKLPVSVALISVKDKVLQPQLIMLDVDTRVKHQ